MRELTTNERTTVEIILLAVKAFNGQFGRGRISQMLAGIRSAESTRSAPDDNACFGILVSLKQNNIMSYLRELENVGLIERIGNPEYPCLGISDEGERFLREKGPLRLALPELKAHGSSKAARAKAQKAMTDQPLYEHLRDLRNKLANRNHVEPVRFCRSLFFTKTVFCRVRCGLPPRMRPRSPDGCSGIPCNRRWRRVPGHPAWPDTARRRCGIRRRR